MSWARLRHGLDAALKRRDILFLYGARFVPGVSNFLLVLVLTQRLEPTHYGRFSIWFFAVLGLAFLFYGWISQSIARHSNGSDDLLSSSPQTFVLGLGLSTGFVALASTVLWAVGILTSGTDALLAAMGVILHGVHSCLGATLQARLRLARYSVVEVIRPIATFAGAVFAIELFDPTSRCAALGYVAGQLIAIVFAYVAISPQRLADVTLAVLQRTNGACRDLRSIIAYGVPISIWLALLTVWPAVERSLLGWLSTPDEVGRYASEYDVAFRSFNFVLLPLTLFLQPKIFKAFSDGGADGVEMLIRAGIKRQVVVGTIFACLYFVAIVLIAPSFGAFESMRPLNVAFLSLAAIAWQVALLCHKWLECGKRVGIMLLSLTGAITAVSIPLSVALFNPYGSVAFAIGFMFAGCTYGAVTFYVGRRLLKRGSYSVAVLHPVSGAG